MNPRPTAKELNIAKRKLQGFLSNELAQRTSRAIIVPYELKDQLQSPRIPNEILRAVLEYVDAITLARVSCACKLFFNIVLNGKYWHALVDSLMDKLNIFPAWRALFNVNDTKKAIYATLHANSKFLKESCYILNWFASNQTGTLDQEINAKSALEKLFRTKYSTNPWKVSTIGREKFENDLTELKKCPPPSVHLQYDSNEARPTLYIRIETSSENHLYPRQTVRFYIPVSDSYPRERPFVYCEPPIYHPFINQATGVVSLEEIEKHFQFVQNQVINNDSYVVRNLNSSLSLSGSTTPVSSPSKLSNSTSSIMNANNNNTLAVEKIERLTASLEIEAKPSSDEICDENVNTKINFEQQQQEVKILPTIIEHPPITITTTNTNQNNQNAPNTPSTPVSSSPHTPSTPSSSTSSTSNSSNFSSPFCSPYRSEGQNVLKSVVDALQNLFVDTSYLTNYMNF